MEQEKVEVLGCVAHPGVSKGMIDNALGQLSPDFKEKIGIERIDPERVKRAVHDEDERIAVVKDILEIIQEDRRRIALVSRRIMSDILGLDVGRGSQLCPLSDKPSTQDIVDLVRTWYGNNT
jgi:hypothetical protein